MTAPYAYLRSGRRPATLIGFAMACGFIVFGHMAKAPWCAIAPVGLAGAMLAVAIVRNRIHGMRIDADALEICQAGGKRRIALAGIAHVRIARWTDTDDTTIHLLDGTQQSLSHLARPPIGELRTALAAFGIAVVTD